MLNILHQESTAGVIAYRSFIAMHAAEGQQHSHIHHRTGLVLTQHIQEPIGIGREGRGSAINGVQKRLEGIAIIRLQPVLNSGFILDLRQAMDRKHIV
jgi:hypothetical protein